MGFLWTHPPRCREARGGSDWNSGRNPDTEVRGNEPISVHARGEREDVRHQHPRVNEELVLGADKTLGEEQLKCT